VGGQGRFSATLRATQVFMSPHRRNVVVGAVVLLALGVLAWMSLQFANKGFAALFTKGTEVTLIAPRGDGVAEGSPVQYLGVNVGQVRDLKLNPDGTGVVINLIINEGNHVPENVQGTIKPAGLLGSTANIGLEPVGAPSKNLIKPGTQLEVQPGSSNTLIPPEVTGIIEDIRKRDLVKHLDETIVTLRDQAVKFGKVMETTGELLGDKKMQADLRATLANLRTTTEKADKITGDFRTLTGQVQSLTANLNTTNRGLNDRIEQLGKTLVKFDSVVAKIDEGDGTLGKLTNDPRLYEALADTSSELRLMVADLKRLVEQWEQEGVSLKLK
jgi:phospholipid/cholesterol/gamma-HCH transport system substrate-binding protein